MKQHSPLLCTALSVGGVLEQIWDRYSVFYADVRSLFVFVVFPVLISIGMSLTNYDMLQTPQFVGLENYKQLFLDDEIFLTALKNTMIFVVVFILSAIWPPFSWLGSSTNWECGSCLLWRSMRPPLPAAWP